MGNNNGLEKTRQTLWRWITMYKWKILAAIMGIFVLYYISRPMPCAPAVRRDESICTIAPFGTYVLTASEEKVRSATLLQEIGQESTAVGSSRLPTPIALVNGPKYDPTVHAHLFAKIEDDGHGPMAWRPGDRNTFLAHWNAWSRLCEDNSDTPWAWTLVLEDDAELLSGVNYHHYTQVPCSAKLLNLYRGKKLWFAAKSPVLATGGLSHDYGAVGYLLRADAACDLASQIPTRYPSDHHMYMSTVQRDGYAFTYEATMLGHGSAPSLRLTKNSQRENAAGSSNGKSPRNNDGDLLHVGVWLVVVVVLVILVGLYVAGKKGSSSRGRRINGGALSPYAEHDDSKGGASR